MRTFITFFFFSIFIGSLSAKTVRVTPKDEVHLKVLITSIGKGVSKDADKEKSILRQSLTITDDDIEIVIKMSGNTAHIKKIVEGKIVEEYVIVLDENMKKVAKRLLQEILNL